MEVTCERCSTVYDFDDALVSERGTTVKCTTCSHQFKVRRTAPTTGPDVWIVRTVDGREIEFAALRDLQAAIYDNRVTREDVLAKGSGRPRRLGSIAELEPFFNRAGPNPQRRARTLAGAGASAVPAVSAQRSETSVVFSLPNLMRSSSDDDEFEGNVNVRRSTLPPPPPMPIPTSSRRDGAPASRRPSIPPPTPRSGSEKSPPPFRRGSIPPPAPTAPSTRRPASVNSSNPGGWFGTPDSSEPEDEWSNTGIERISALPPPPPMPRRSAPPPPPMFPSPEPPPPPAETVKAPRMFPDPEPTKLSKPPTPPPEEAPPKVISVEVPRTSSAPERPSQSNASEQASSPDKPAADKPEVPATNETEAKEVNEQATEERSSKPAANDPSTKSPISERMSSPSSTSTPLPSSRRSEPYSDPRNSGAIPSRRAGAARWIVGFVLLGCTALAAVTIIPKVLSKPSTSAGSSDSRVASLLEQGDRAMNDGDLDAANDAYIKASAIADADPKVDLRLARLAIVRADIPWLKVRLLAETDPDLANTRREVVLAATRAHQAAERAQASLPNDPDVTRCRIDALRLQGNVTEARKLVAQLLKPTGVSNDEVVFALLDLAEPSPTWSSVTERLSNAARSEQNLGHARTMLIYALVQSGDITRAKAELDQLVAMPRPHPLLGAFRAFIARAEKESANGGAEVEEAGAPVDDTALLQSANDAITSGDLEKAAGILKDLKTRLPSDANVLTASGKLALKRKDRAAAAKLFEKALSFEKNQFDAMAALADIKWDSGEKQGASILYRQIIERAGADSPHMAQAKERFSAFTDGIGME